MVGAQVDFEIRIVAPKHAVHARAGAQLIDRNDHATMGHFQDWSSPKGRRRWLPQPGPETKTGLALLRIEIRADLYRALWILIGGIAGTIIASAGVAAAVAR